MRSAASLSLMARAAPLPETLLAAKMPTRFGSAVSASLTWLAAVLRSLLLYRTLATLRSGQALMPCAEAGLAVLEHLDAGHRGGDQDVAARAATARLDELAQARTGLLGRLAVVGPDEALVIGGHGRVGDDHLGAALAGALDHVVERVGRVRRDDDRVGAARDRVLDQLDLLVDVGLRRRAEQADLDAVVGAGLLRAGQHRLPERRVGRLDDHVDLLAGHRAAAAAPAARRRPAGRAAGDDAEHDRRSARSRPPATART